MAGGRSELKPKRSVADTRAAIGLAARRALHVITGGASAGPMLALRLVLLSLPLLAAAAVFVLFALVGVVTSFTAANAGTGGACGVTAGSLLAANGPIAHTSPTATIGGSPAQRMAELKPVYQAAASQFQLGPGGWAYLAAINEVETDFGLNLSVSSAGAIGWMQFEPATFLTYAVKVNGTASPDPYNPYDAIFAAANMLHANGAPGDWSGAIFTYNHANWYVQEVETLAQSYAGGGTPTAQASSSSCAFAGTTVGPTAQITSSGMALAPASAPVAVQQLIAAGNGIIDKPYPSPDQHYGPLSTMWPAYDCSGSTSYVLYKAGLLGDSALVSGGFESWGASGPGRWITIYANSGHVFVVVAGIVLNTAWYSAVKPSFPSSGPRWQPGSTVAEQISGDRAGGFTVRHPAGL